MTSVIVYACATCKGRFPDREAMRVHFGTDLHAFNVERKVQGLVPLDEASYQVVQTEAAGTVDRQTKFYCKICKKSYTCVQTLSQHLRSQAHLKAKAAARRDDTTSVAGSTASMSRWVRQSATRSTTLGAHCANCKNHGHSKANCPTVVCGFCKAEGHIVKDCPTAPCKLCEQVGHKEKDCTEKDSAREPTEAELAQCCFMCPHVSPDVETAAAHLKEEHFFKIPLTGHLTSKAGLLSYLYRKVSSGMCLWCGERSKENWDVSRVRQHMIAQGHGQLNWTDDVDEYAEFYDLPEPSELLIANEYGEHMLKDGRSIMGKLALKEKETHEAMAFRAQRSHALREKRAEPLLLEDGQEQKLLTGAKKRQSYIVQYAKSQGLQLQKAQLKRLAVEDRLVQKQLRLRDYNTRDRARPMFHGHMITVHST